MEPCPKCGSVRCNALDVNFCRHTRQMKYEQVAIEGLMVPPLDKMVRVEQTAAKRPVGRPRKEA